MTMRLRTGLSLRRTPDPAEESLHPVSFRTRGAFGTDVTAVRTWGHHDGRGTGKRRRYRTARFWAAVDLADPRRHEGHRARVPRDPSDPGPARALSRDPG